MTHAANWNYPTSIRFGAGRVAELPRLVAEAGMARPMLVTDPSLAQMPMLRDALAALQAQAPGAAVFSAIKPNPVGANVDAGVAVYRAGGHDGVVEIGRAHV